MPVTLNHRPFTIDEYTQMAEVGILTEDNRIELIKGDILDMSPIGTKHAACLKHLNRLLSMRNIEDKVIIQVQDPIQLPNDSEPEPDLAIIKYRDDFYAAHHPYPEDILLVIEVADSSLQYDHEVKLPVYAEANIPEVWIVNLNDQRLEVYTEPKTSNYGLRRLYNPEDQVMINAINMTVNVSDFMVA